MKVAIVTGGCRGIGLAATEIFLEQGWAVAVVDRDTDELRSRLVCTSGDGTLSVIDVRAGKKGVEVSEDQEDELLSVAAVHGCVALGHGAC